MEDEREGRKERKVEGGSEKGGKREKEKELDLEDGRVWSE